jgi:hypothetical protein
MSYQDILGGPGNDCEHLAVGFDDRTTADNTRIVQTDCRDCGQTAFEIGSTTDTFLADLD